MGLETLCVLAIAGSVVSLATSLVVALRSTPQRVRAAAQSAVEISEETQNGFRVAAIRMATFMEEISRERDSAAGDLQEAERKRRQAAAKLSALEKRNPESEAPKTVAEALALLPVGDPRRMSLLRRQKMMLGDNHA